jgi:hypothetical protein
MATNRVMKPGWQQSLVVSDPATPTSGDPVRIGTMTGVALTDEGDGGNGATETTVDVGPAVWDLSVKGVDASGNSAVALGDPIYYVDADTPKLSKKNTGYFFGIALEAVGSGQTATINVQHVPSPGAGTLANGAVGSAQLADGALSADAIGEDLLTPAELTGRVVATVADANVIGGIPVLHRIDIADAATGDVDVVLTHKTRVTDVWAVKTGALGGAANTVQVKNGATAITDALDINIADKTIARATTIDDAQHDIAAAGTLRITRTKAGGNAACTVYVLGIRVA